MLVTSNFSFTHSVFYPFSRIFCFIFIRFKIVVCRLSIWKKKSVVCTITSRNVGSVFSKMKMIESWICKIFELLYRVPDRRKLVGWLVVLGFNATLTGHIMAVGDAYVFPGFLIPVLTQLFYPNPHLLLFLHASAEVRGKNMPVRSSPQTGIELTTTRS